MTYTIHATRKLTDRLHTTPQPAVAASGVLGNWYANLLPGRSPLVLFVDTTTMYPVFVRCAPARTLLARFPTEFATVLNRIGIDPRFVHTETAAMVDPVVAKTVDRQMIGVLNELAFMARTCLDHGHDPSDLTGLSVIVSTTLLSPLYRHRDGAGSPDRALTAVAANTLAG